MSQIGIIAFDEAHHCASDHPYAQVMEDFYHTSPANSRPQIVGLTASPSECQPHTVVRPMFFEAAAAANSKFHAPDAVKCCCIDSELLHS